MRLCLITFFFIGFLANAQDPDRFADQVASIQQKYETHWDGSKETIVFTGSSTIRMWKNLQTLFPEHQIINSGFGGSQASDLLAYSDELISNYRPKKVFIYEGDNDIFAKKKPKEIIATFEQLIAQIRDKNQNIQIVLLAAKPSLARWELKRKYKQLNRKFKKLSKKDATVEYVDVWHPMLDGKTVKQDIFIEDGLHMNAKGYGLWYDVIKPYVEKP
ncbi:GDSL-type esterase/lipase family protein [Kriegella aquimaris]|uniref:Lysophospholipase L1 n=1 Tax=Kriegella aquimaris TaxID=192904 RepID=A0A1G9YEA1_9FLAO|nr:GDSL-type esterase/lipase family protein [Kriegella aquimaris]SDN07367.1 Lysophospholipase L1 [Kriegella aquimaris]